MEEKRSHFAPVTGKQCERVEELFGDDAKDFWILGDSAARIKHNGKFVYESLLSNKLGLEMIRLLENKFGTYDNCMYKKRCGHKR